MKEENRNSTIDLCTQIDRVAVRGQHNARTRSLVKYYTYCISLLRGEGVTWLSSSADRKGSPVCGKYDLELKYPTANSCGGSRIY